MGRLATGARAAGARVVHLTYLPLAGGQSLVPMLNLRLAPADRLVDLTRIDALKQIVARADARSEAWWVFPAVPLLAAAIAFTWTLHGEL